MLLAPFGIVPETLQRAERTEFDVREHETGNYTYDKCISWTNIMFIKSIIIKAVNVGLNSENKTYSHVNFEQCVCYPTYGIRDIFKKFWDKTLY